MQNQQRQNYREDANGQSFAYTVRRDGRGFYLAMRPLYGNKKWLRWSPLFSTEQSAQDYLDNLAAENGWRAIQNQREEQP